MPGLNGLDTALRLQTLPLTHRPAHMMVTAYSDQIPREDAVSAGFTRILTKPVTPSLKGLAGTLGAVRLEQAALEAEKLVRRIGPDNEIEHRLNTMITELTGLLLALDTVFHQKNDSRLIADVDRSKIADILNQLETFLSANDAAANDLFEQSRFMLTASLGRTAEKLGRQIDDFDYADALNTLLSARKNSFL
jgi:CheY-like chemotaxis protein